VSARYQIRSIPTLLLIDRGILRERAAGAMPEDAIIRFAARQPGPSG
jgi:thioredoxin-like negative regulator of GroEL